MQGLKKTVHYQIEIYRNIEKKNDIQDRFNDKFIKIKSLMSEVKLKLDGEECSLWNLDHHYQSD